MRDPASTEMYATGSIRPYQSMLNILGDLGGERDGHQSRMNTL